MKTTILVASGLLCAAVGVGVGVVALTGPTAPPTATVSSRTAVNTATPEPEHRRPRADAPRDGQAGRERRPDARRPREEAPPPTSTVPTASVDPATLTPGAPLPQVTGGAPPPGPVVRPTAPGRPLPRDRIDPPADKPITPPKPPAP